MTKTIRTLVAAACLLAVPPLALSATAPATAHPGGLNSQGCHGGSRPYHCHRSPSEMRRTADGRNRLRCDLGSLSSECAGRTERPGSQPSPVIRSMQQQLIRHCPHLPSNFADGFTGTSTRAALRVFQEAYDLTVDGQYGTETAAALAGPVTGACQGG